MLSWTYRIVWGLSGVLAVVACSSNDPKLTAPAQQGGRGESCQARNDCRDGLACVANVCSQNDFPITVTAKQCDLIQCATKDDCCKTFTPSSTCDTYQQGCSAGDQVYCGYVQQYCTCQMDCRENRCVSVNSCSTDADCFGGVCVNGACVDCRADTDCSSNFKCVSGTCKAGCTKNEECNLLETCDGGQCVKSGCQSDRECIGFSGNKMAKCVDKKCAVPCENDAECGRFEVCESGSCVFIGCETNDECRYLTENFTPNSNVTAVCR